MIRFHCPSCSREYVLADALAHLPLLCKGCGHHMVVPEPTPDEPPPPPPKPSFERALPRSKPDERAALEESLRETDLLGPSIEDSEVDLFQTAELRTKKMRRTSGGSNPMAKPESGAVAVETPPRLPIREPIAAPPATNKTLGSAVDVAVGVILLVMGMFVGEVVAGKKTGQILSNITGPKFPPMDLVLWLGCVVFFVLVYGWLATRGWTLGGWLKRRAA